MCCYPAVVNHSHFSYHGDIPLQELIDSRQTGESRLNRVQTLAPTVKANTTAQGCKHIDSEMQALQSDWKQWEESVFQTRSGLEELVSQMALSEQEFTAQAAQLEEALQHFSTLLATWSERLTPLDSKHTDKEIVESWHREKVWLATFFLPLPFLLVKTRNRSAARRQKNAIGTLNWLGKVMLKALAQVL